VWMIGGFVRVRYSMSPNHWASVLFSW
jgi:hypothetical protein